jgi:hypothetical protein
MKSILSASFMIEMDTPTMDERFLFLAGPVAK